MKNSKTEIPLAARNYLASIGSTGGKNGSIKNKRKAALVRWNKPGARKSISRNQAGE